MGCGALWFSDSPMRCLKYCFRVKEKKTDKIVKSLIFNKSIIEYEMVI